MRLYNTDDKNTVPNFWWVALMTHGQPQKFEQNIFSGQWISTFFYKIFKSFSLLIRYHRSMVGHGAHNGPRHRSIWWLPVRNSFCPYKPVKRNSEKSFLSKIFLIHKFFHVFYLNAFEKKKSGIFVTIRCNIFIYCIVRVRVHCAQWSFQRASPIALRMRSLMQPGIIGAINTARRIGNYDWKQAFNIVVIQY